MIFRWLILLGILFAFDWYAYQAIAFVSQGWQKGTKLLVQGLYWGIPLLGWALVLGHSLHWYTLPKELLLMVRLILFITYVAKFLMSLVLLVDDFRRAALWVWDKVSPADNGFDPSRSKFLSKMALFAGTAPIALLSYGVLRNAYRYQIHKHKVHLPHLPAALEGLKIVQISDIHSGSFFMTDPIKEGIDLINDLQPDLVFFTGDLVNSVATEIEPYVQVFSGIKARHGAYSVLGNHDYGDYVMWNTPEEKTANLNSLKNHHRSIGWNLLMNEHKILEINGHKVGVVGVENYSAHPRFPKYGKMSEAVANMEPTDINLLLSHDPTHWRDQILPEHKNIDVTFSGHTHGGQFGIEIPGFLRWSPVQYVYKEWAGLYQEGKQYLYVNRGFGFLGYPGRVGILPEITCIELTRNPVS